MSPRPRRLIAFAALTLIVGCADAPQPEPDSGTEPGAAAPDAADPADLVASCGGIAFDGVPADPAAFPPLGDDAAARLNLTGLGVEAEFFDRYDWAVASETGDTLHLFGVPQERVDGAPPYAHAEFAADGERWVPEGWGQCRITVATPGWGNARFVLDPDVEPDPDATGVPVLAWEVGCASGRTPEGREVRPVVLSQDSDTVSIVILVEPAGGADCQSNPSFPLEITLDAPLGDRSIYDASVEPALARPWPPTESSLSSEGRDG